MCGLSRQILHWPNVIKYKMFPPNEQSGITRGHVTNIRHNSEHLLRSPRPLNCLEISTFVCPLFQSHLEHNIRGGHFIFWMLVFSLSWCWYVIFRRIILFSDKSRCLIIKWGYDPDSDQDREDYRCKKSSYISSSAVKLRDISKCLCHHCPEAEPRQNIWL